MTSQTPFALTPAIYALLVCSDVQRDTVTGAWVLRPLSHLAVRRLPATLQLYIVARIMAPPGDYTLQFRMFHSDQPQPDVALTQPLVISVQRDRNIDYSGQITVTVSLPGLYILEAALPGFHTALAPLRVSLIDS
jgi:hypothetical protein